jgi:hypothetical protein
MSLRKVLPISLSTILIVFLFGCKKDNNTPPAVITVKYEITTTAPLLDTTAMGSIQYTDSTGTDRTTSDFYPGHTSWTKTFTLTTATRPLTLKLSTPISYFLASQGSITGKIYVNDVLQTTSFSSTTNSFNIFYASLSETTAVVN